LSDPFESLRRYYDVPKRSEGVRAVATAMRSICPRQKLLHFAQMAFPRVVEVLLGSGKSEVSVLAVVAGQQFETSLWANGAQRMLEVYPEYQVLDMQADKQCSAELLSDPPKSPMLVRHVALELPFALDNVTIRPDFVVGDPEIGWLPGEIKIYLDRFSRTDPHQLALACSQLAVGALAMEHVTGLPAPRLGHLILRRHGGPSRREMALDMELEALRAYLPISAVEAKELVQVQTIEQAPYVWSANCRELCPLDKYCAPVLLRSRVIQDVALRFQTTPDRVEALFRGVVPERSSEQQLAEALRLLNEDG